MTGMEVVRAIMKIKDVTVGMLAKRLGLNSSSAMSMRFKQKNISVSLLSEMMKVMDYKVVVVPSNTRMQSDWFEVE